jgi:hypothetical protein
MANSDYPILAYEIDLSDAVPGEMTPVSWDSHRWAIVSDIVNHNSDIEY